MTATAATWAAIWAVTLLPWVCSAQAAAVRLSAAGTDLGVVGAPAEPADFTVSVDVSGERPQHPFVVARFQNNQPLMLGVDGAWTAWDGDNATLHDAAVTASGHALEYVVPARSLPAPFFPVTFSVGYWSGGEMVFGHFTVTEP
ncbi:MAG: hypothetical protein SFV19_08540 [Rhodospirillaceae bacterium]|nr:hypothetical protein [Rhodospirillaceae bacterium]